MHTTHHKDLKVLMEITRPDSILLIDPNPEGLPPNILPANCRVKQLKDDIITQLQTLGLFDLGIVANTLEHLDRKSAGILLARLRDLNTRRFVVLAPVGKGWENQRTHWERNDFIGYGMTLMAHYRLDNKSLHLYHYAIESYKTIPEWFNSKHWAHPELWRP
jgi:hypothetical protein